MNSQVIPEDAVEAAAKAHYGLLTGGGADEWGFLHKQGQSELLALTRAALEAAAPHMPQLSRRQGSRAVGGLIKAAKANAWDEAYGKGFEAARGEPDTPNPYRSQA